MIEVTDSTFRKEVLEHDGIVVVDFRASKLIAAAHWYSPYKIFMLELENLAKHYEGKVKFVKLDVDKNEYTANKYSIKNIPTILIFKNGEWVDGTVGTTTRTHLMSCIDGVIHDNKR